MPYNPHIHNRQSTRLAEYDYSSPGGYFVTVVAQHRECLFGDISDGAMILNDAGRMVGKIWTEIPEFYPNFELDSFQIMPNHMHGILHIVGAAPCGCPDQNVYTDDNHNINGGQPQGVAPTLSLGNVMQRFKTMTSNEYLRGVKHNNYSAFHGSLWQRNYWDHIIRNDSDLSRIREYIVNNPLQWEFDKENPNHT